jgi:hypothetical protein
MQNYVNSQLNLILERHRRAKGAIHQEVEAHRRGVALQRVSRHADGRGGRLRRRPDGPGNYFFWTHIYSWIEQR